MIGAFASVDQLFTHYVGDPVLLFAQHSLTPKPADYTYTPYTSGSEYEYVPYTSSYSEYVPYTSSGDALAKDSASGADSCGVNRVNSYLYAGSTYEPPYVYSGSSYESPYTYSGSTYKSG